VKQFVLPPSFAGPGRLALGAADARYLTRVRRLREGDVLPAVDAAGGRWVLTVARVARGACEVDVAPAHAPLAPAAAASPGGLPGEPPNGGRMVTLLQCLPKGRKIDLIVRQATEAGVARIIPLVSARTVVRADESDGRTARLRRVAREAVQQSGAPRVPAVEEPRALASLAGEDWGTALLLHESAGAGTGSLHGALADAGRRVSVLVGPEGGLSDAEVALLAAAGFRAVRLQAAVLRVETAAIFALGAVMTVLRERDEWQPVRQ
jgi:16S rRNA (uracil1498-N3)-methyltransferase